MSEETKLDRGTLAALKELISEVRKPSIAEQAKLDQEEKDRLDRLQERKENGAGILEEMEARKRFRSICNHKRKNGTSRAVFITTGNYFLCQEPECRIIVRPGNRPKDDKSEDVYDNKLYNEMVQSSRTTDL